MTGDGVDELLAGYSYMAELDDLEEYIKKISPFLFFLVPINWPSFSTSGSVSHIWMRSLRNSRLEYQ